MIKRVSTITNPKGNDSRQRIGSSVFLFTLILSNVEISQLIDIPVLVGCNHPKPIPNIVLFQVLLGQIFQIPEKGLMN